MTLTADEARAIRAIDRVTQATRELGRAGREAGRETQSAFDDVQKELTKVAEGFTAAAAGRLVFNAIKEEVNGLRDALKQLNQETANTARGEGAAFKNLAQLGPENYGASVTLAKRLKDQGGLSDAEATQATFGLAQAGLLNSGGADVAIKAAKLGLGPDAVKRAAALERGLGREVTAESVDRLLAHATAVAPGQATETLEAMTRESAQARTLGVGEDELLVAQGIAGRRSSSPERAALGMHQLLEGLNKRGIAGGSLAEKIANAKKQGWSAKVLGDFYGKEGSELLNTLDPDELRGGVAGLDGSTLGTAVDAMRSDSSVGAYIDERDARARNARDLEGRGSAQLHREAVRAQFQTRMRAKGYDQAEINALMNKNDGSSFFGLGDYFGESHPDGFGDPEKGEALRGFVGANWNPGGSAPGNSKTPRSVEGDLGDVFRAIEKNTREANKRAMSDPNRDK